MTAPVWSASAFDLVKDLNVLLVEANLLTNALIAPLRLAVLGALRITIKNLVLLIIVQLIFAQCIKQEFLLMFIIGTLSSAKKEWANVLRTGCLKNGLLKLLIKMN